MWSHQDSDQGDISGSGNFESEGALTPIENSMEFNEELENDYLSQNNFSKPVNAIEKAQKYLSDNRDEQRRKRRERRKKEWDESMSFSFSDDFPNSPTKKTKGKNSNERELNRVSNIVVPVVDRVVETPPQYKSENSDVEEMDIVFEDDYSDFPQIERDSKGTLRKNSSQQDGSKLQNSQKSYFREDTNEFRTTRFQETNNIKIDDEDNEIEIEFEDSPISTNNTANAMKHQKNLPANQFHNLENDDNDYAIEIEIESPQQQVSSNRSNSMGKQKINNSEQDYGEEIEIEFEDDEMNQPNKESVNISTKQYKVSEEDNALNESSILYAADEDYEEDFEVDEDLDESQNNQEAIMTVSDISSVSSVEENQYNVESNEEPNKKRLNVQKNEMAKKNTETSQIEKKKKNIAHEEEEYSNDFERASSVLSGSVSLVGNAWKHSDVVGRKMDSVQSEMKTENRSKYSSVKNSENDENLKNEAQKRVRKVDIEIQTELPYNFNGPNFNGNSNAFLPFQGMPPYGAPYNPLVHSHPQHSHFMQQSYYGMPFVPPTYNNFVGDSLNSQSASTLFRLQLNRIMDSLENCRKMLLTELAPRSSNYSTLEDIKQFIKSTKRPTLTLEEALKIVDSEGN